MIDFLKGTVGKDYFSDRLYGCQECIAEYLASKEPLSQPTNQSFTNRFIESRIIWIGSTAGMYTMQRMFDEGSVCKVITQDTDNFDEEI